jgi:hypothetical protein
VPPDLLLDDDNDHGCETPGRGCYQTRHQKHDNDMTASEMTGIVLSMLFLVLLALFAYSSCGAHRVASVYVPLRTTTKPPFVAHNDDETVYVFE